MLVKKTRAETFHQSLHLQQKEENNKATKTQKQEKSI